MQTRSIFQLTLLCAITFLTACNSQQTKTSAGNTSVSNRISVDTSSSSYQANKKCYPFMAKAQIHSLLYILFSKKSPEEIKRKMMSPRSSAKSKREAKEFVDRMLKAKAKNITQIYNAEYKYCMSLQGQAGDTARFWKCQRLMVVSMHGIHFAGAAIKGRDPANDRLASFTIKTIKNSKLKQGIKDMFLDAVKNTTRRDPFHLDKRLPDIFATCAVS